MLDFSAISGAGRAFGYGSLSDLIAGGARAFEQASYLVDVTDSRSLIALDAVTLLAPLPSLKKNIFCVGRNYHEHVAEGFRAAGREISVPQFPQFFTKAPTAANGPDAEFELDPAVTSKLDYEAELAVVIGKAGRDISRDDAMDHVFGFTVVNDITARDLQRRHDQWFKGKSLDGSAPMGPAIVTPDELANLGEVEVVARVNGEERQRGRVGQMIFDIPEIIAQLSAGLTLEPGDIIATGTPSGVGYAMDPPRFLTAGDVVECEISGIGRIVTRIVEAGAKP